MPERTTRAGWRLGLPWLRMKRGAQGGLALVAAGTGLAFLAPTAGIALVVAGVLIAVLAVCFGVLAAAADRPQRARMSFGGRYTDFGFLFAIVDGTWRRGRTCTPRSASRDERADSDRPSPHQHTTERFE